MHVQLAGSARAIPSCRTDESGTLMMLPTDIALVRDPGFRPYVELYAKSQDAWFRDFAAAVRLLVSWLARVKCRARRIRGDGVCMHVD